MIRPYFLGTAVGLGYAILLLTGCNPPAGTGTQATEVSTGSATSAAAGELPSDDEILRQIDDALDYTYANRRLTVGQREQDQAAWQIIHGALAFKREFLVNDGARDVSAVDYLLAGR
jgi:hypothetical protein